ncbi:MAG TPA: FG-GAP repeat protein [Bryobacteraceae bacterium]|nr:FG-GAP repeat protein [Bryobacteraceae bacterium]
MNAVGLILAVGSSYLTAGAANAALAKTGADAIAALKASGSYNSLQKSWRQAQYAMQQDRGEYLARNAAQKLDLRFRASDATLRLAGDTGRASVAFEFLGFGYGDRWAAPERARLVGSANRIEYRRGALTEWYVNDERGLEQGFRVATRPGTEAGPLLIALGVNGALPQKTTPSDVTLLDSSGRAVLRYGELRAWDSQQRPLPARMEVQDHEIRLLVDDSRAMYPITIDPTISAVILLASDGVSSDQLGTSLAVDGNTAVLGAPGQSIAKGGVQVFVRSGSTWTQQTTLTSSDGVPGDRFGSSVSVSGSTILVGAPGQAGQGAAYVFTQTGTSWSQQAKLTASDGNTGDAFGSSVSLSGGTGVVGAPGKAKREGAVYVFTFAAGVWNQQAEFMPNDAASGDAFGN